MDHNELNEPTSVTPETVRKIWAGVTMTIGADVSANWQDITMMLRDDDRSDDGVLTEAACQRIAAKLSDMVVRRHRILAEESSRDDAFSMAFERASRDDAEAVRDEHLDGEPCPDCLDTWPCLRLTRALRVLMNHA